MVSTKLRADHIIKYEQIIDRIIEVRHQKVILDSDVAELYDVETKRVNEAATRNPEKFPSDYLIHLTKLEKSELVANCDRLKKD